MLEALRAGVPIKRITLARDMKALPVLREIEELATASAVPIGLETRQRLHAISGTRSHQGVVALVQPFAYQTPERLLRRDGTPRLVLLDGVTDPGNLGSLLRSAEAFGWNGMLIPRHRAVGVTPAVRKVASGAAERVPVARVGSAAETVRWLRREGIRVVGLDPSGPQPYRELVCGDREAICLVVGAEGRGLSRLVRERCDAVVRIPMHGSLASLNVAVTAAIVMAELSLSGEG